MTVSAATATDRLRAYQSRHRIEVDKSSEWDRCDTDGVRVHMTLNRRWFHDPDELRKLQSAAAREDLDRGIATFEDQRVARVITEASAPLRAFETPTLRLVPQREVPLVEVVIEDRDGYLVTADVPCPSCLEGDIVPHGPNPRCESGQRPHCTCDSCW